MHPSNCEEVDDVSDRCTGKSIIDIFGSKRNGQAIVCRSLRILSHFYAIINHCFRFDSSAVSSLYCATVKKENGLASSTEGTTKFVKSFAAWQHQLTSIRIFCHISLLSPWCYFAQNVISSSVWW